MPVESFNKSDFEATLPIGKSTGDPLWIHAGLIDGEHVYHIDIAGTNKRIVIRSSIGRDGVSAGTGQDSIRLSLLFSYRGEWRPLAKLDRWTTRVPGWQNRVTAKLRELYQLALTDSKNHRNGNGKVATDPDTPKSVTKPRPRLNFGAPTITTPPQLPPQERTPNAEQVMAITAPVDAQVRVLAPPGAGKTFVIARRYAFLLENGATPDDILAVTFSKSMADELLQRIIRVNPEVEDTAAKRQVCTIHAACYRILRAEGDTRQVVKQWQVKRLLQETTDSLWPYADERPGWKEIIYWIDAAKAEGITSADDLGFYTEALGGYHGRNLHEARRRFDGGMRRKNLLTFADMLFDVEQRLTHDYAFCEKWQAKFKWVIQDEAQDANPQDWRILSALAAPQNRVTVVADVDQSLYVFRGARPKNMLERFDERYPDATTIKLRINYRSTRTIIESCQHLIANNYADADGPYDQRFLKDMRPRPDAPAGDPVTFDIYNSPEEESEAVVNNLLETIANGRKPGDFFIGARTRAQLGYLEGPLTRAKIPFINITGNSFWASKHVSDVIAYLTLAHDTSNDKAFARIFNIASRWNVYPWGEHAGEYCSHRYLGRAFLAACNGSYQDIWRAARQRRSFQSGVEDLAQFIYKLQAEITEGPVRVLQVVVDDCYRRYLESEEGIVSSDEAENGKLEDLETAIDIARQFDSINKFLDYVRDAIAAAQAAKDKDWSEHVVISTWHRLKGQESEVVYGVGCCEGASQNGKPAGLLPHTFSMTPPPQNGVLPTGGMGSIPDERNVMYVAVSRAKSECHLSGCSTYRTAEMHASRFITELGLLKGE